MLGSSGVGNQESTFIGIPKPNHNCYVDSVPSCEKLEPNSHCKSEWLQ